MKKNLTIGIVFLCLGASIVSAINVDVSSNPQPLGRGWLYVGGSGSGNYTTIQSAIDATIPGDTIFVYNGTYNENVVVIQKNNITLQGEDKQTTIINANGSEESFGSMYIDTSHSIRISGFTLHGYNAPSVYFRDSSDKIIFDCILSDSTYGAVIYTEYTSMNNTVKDCEIFNNTYGVGIGGAAADYYLNRSKVFNCSIHDNEIGISIKGRSDWYGIINNTIITGCNIFNNTEKGIFINQLLGKILGTTIYHNNIVNNAENAYENATNIWYNITLLEGNYWSDYNGTDDDGDGIGDTPYNISGGSNQDLYPFMYQNGWVPPSYVWVDDDFNSTTPGWGFDHFNTIQYGIDAVAEPGTVHVYEGIYKEEVLVTKYGIKLEGENAESTIINANKSAKAALYVDSTEYITIYGFTLHCPLMAGVYFMNSSTAMIVGSIISNCSYGAVINAKDTAEDIIIADCDISHNTLSGVLLTGSGENYSLDQNTILNCTIHDNERYGIQISGTPEWFGNIYETHISDCEISDNAGKGIAVTQVNGSIQNIIIENSRIQNNAEQGITITNVSDVIITDCVVSQNNITGIHLTSTSEAIIYHNNIIDNTRNAYDDGTNQWYDSLLHEGNYWSDYTGEDENGDAIGDTPYNIPGGSSQDRYPLMYPLESYYILVIHLENQTVNESTPFRVVVKSQAGVSIQNAAVEFNNEIYTTDENGTVSITAPAVAVDTIFEITATKPGYTGASASIQVNDTSIEFKNTLIVGKIFNLRTVGSYITFQALNIRTLSLQPSRYHHYNQGETITISINYFGILRYKHIFAICKVPII